ncbi:hypothetical protein R1flu_000441 [Riccia fluitans]|uniref:Uncharacterized protein n=1 Tax=Riccia fluitans TaxID=41844 RepID=A0ABD1Y0T4_9MARC
MHSQGSEVQIGVLSGPVPFTIPIHLALDHIRRDAVSLTRRWQTTRGITAAAFGAIGVRGGGYLCMCYPEMGRTAVISGGIRTRSAREETRAIVLPGGSLRPRRICREQIIPSGFVM